MSVVTEVLRILFDAMYIGRQILTISADFWIVTLEIKKIWAL